MRAHCLAPPPLVCVPLRVLARPRRSCTHPNLIKYYGAALKGKEVFIVTEFMEGGAFYILRIVAAPAAPSVRERLVLRRALSRCEFCVRPRAFNPLAAPPAPCR